MIPHVLFLQYLLFMELGSGIRYDRATENCFVIRSGSQLPICNRILHTKTPTQIEIDEIKAYFKGLPINWFVLDSDQTSIDLLQNTGLVQTNAFPAMIIDLDKIPNTKRNNDFMVKEITDNSAVEEWVSITSRAFGIDKKEFTTAFNYIVKNANPNSLKLYLGFYQQKPVATCMAIYHQGIISLHWISVLPEYRGAGFGTAITIQPLLDAHNNGGNRAILLASQLGKPVYEKIGFKEYALYKVFDKKTN